MSCAVCRKPGNEAVRAQWGCDGPSDHSPFPLRLNCWFCEGKDRDCEHCKGTKMILFRRCPNAVIGPDIWDAVRASAMLEQGLLPRGTSWLDLTGSLLEALKVIGSERRKIQEDRNGR